MGFPNALVTMPSITDEDVVQMAREVGFAVPDADIGDYKELLQRTKTTLDTIMNMEGSQLCSRWTQTIDQTLTPHQTISPGIILRQLLEQMSTSHKVKRTRFARGHGDVAASTRTPLPIYSRGRQCASKTISLWPKCHAS